MRSAGRPDERTDREPDVRRPPVQGGEEGPSVVGDEDHRRGSTDPEEGRSGRVRPGLSSP